MSQIWVRAKSILYAEKNGQMTSFYPGDWLQVGRKQARDGLRDGLLEILKPAVLQTVQDLTDCSIVIRGVLSENQRIDLASRFPGVPIENYAGWMPNGRFLLWDMAANLRQDLILTGFGLLTKWQLAVPLLNYDTLAQDIGTADEQAETKAIIHDLRVPVYDSRVLFVRQCQETRRLFELWQTGSDLGFLRALYQARPVVNALPPSWIL